MSFPNGFFMLFSEHRNWDVKNFLTRYESVNSFAQDFINSKTENNIKLSLASSNIPRFEAESTLYYNTFNLRKKHTILHLFLLLPKTNFTRGAKWIQVSL